MLFNIIYIILALLGVGFLVFIHELGHYFMARRVGITVEVFAIGFGKAIYEWEHKGVKWKLGWLPFGGYVKMAGTEKTGLLEPSQIPDGFFGKKPWDRIKVALAGPVCNLVFAFLAFTCLWMIGGRAKPFSEFTHLIGWVDRDSALYQASIRPGDEVETLNGRPFKGFQDLLYASVLDNRTTTITGQEIDYFKGEKKPFEFSFTEGANLKGLEKASLTLNTMQPASYLLYDRLPSGNPNPLHEGSPLKDSGISYGDRLLWVDGQLVFSRQQLIQILNDSKALLTVERAGQTFLTRLPRLKVADLRLSSNETAELEDWSYEAGLSQKVQELYFIPYNLNAGAVVESPLAYIDQRSQPQSAFEKPPRTFSEIPLEPGDRIIAVDGLRISTSYELFSALQKKHVQIIVERLSDKSLPSWKKGDELFVSEFDITSLDKIASSIGSDQLTQSAGNLRLLRSVVPIKAEDFPLSEEKRVAREEKLNKQRQIIEEMPEGKERDEKLKELEVVQKRLMLGITLQDRLVAYNPSPLTLFGNVFQETWRTLSALVTGYLSPKNLMGPVGIVQVIHSGWALGVKEALFWLGMISLNLGILNLLPIPVLDGGHICIAIVESITKKPLKAKTMEKLIIPFVVLLVAFFIYLTYHDISRLVNRFF